MKASGLVSKASWSTSDSQAISTPPTTTGPWTMTYDPSRSSPFRTDNCVTTGVAHCFGATGWKAKTCEFKSPLYVSGQLPAENIWRMCGLMELADLLRVWVTRWKVQQTIPDYFIDRKPWESHHHYRHTIATILFRNLSLPTPENDSKPISFSLHLYLRPKLNCCGKLQQRANVCPLFRSCPSLSHPHLIG